MSIEAIAESLVAEHARFVEDNAALDRCLRGPGTVRELISAWKEEADGNSDSKGGSDTDAQAQA